MHDYISFVDSMWVSKHLPVDMQLSIACLGIGEENGEMLEAIEYDNTEELVYELGDILYYIVTIARLIEVPLDENPIKIEYTESDHHYMYNRLIIKSSKLQGIIKKYLRNKEKCPLDRVMLVMLLNSMLSLLVSVGFIYGAVDLQEIIRCNIEKISGRKKENSISDLTKRTF
jgi:hypothetical protein